MAKKEELFKMIKKMSPGDVLNFVAEQMGMNFAEMLAKNAGSIALKAVKSGWAKAGGIKDAVKGFSDKTKSDDTGIDWDNVEIEEAGFKMSCLFDGESGKKLKEFVKKLGDQMKKFAEEEKKINENKLFLNENTHMDMLNTIFSNALSKPGSSMSIEDCIKASGPKAIEFWKNFKDEDHTAAYQFYMMMSVARDGAVAGARMEMEEIFSQNSTKWAQAAAKAYMKTFGKKLAAQTIKNTLEKQVDSAQDTLDKAADQVSAASDAIDNADTPKEAVAAAGASKEAAKEMANDEEMKKQAAEKAGVKAFTPLGWARLAAKTTGYVLNHSKDVVDALGAKKIAKGEDKNVIAEIRTQIENTEGSDKNYSDSEFSVRFTTDDFKWHATCIDDRKMQIPEDTLVKKVLDTDSGKKFKEFCLKKWKSMFGAKPDGDYAMLPFILGNLDKFGLKGGSEEFFNKVKAVADNMDKIEQQFK